MNLKVIRAGHPPEPGITRKVIGIIGLVPVRAEAVPTTSPREIKRDQKQKSVLKTLPKTWISQRADLGRQISTGPKALHWK